MPEEPVSNEYREGIRSAWQGEQWGQAFFERLAQATENAGHRAKWRVLAELEEATGTRLAPLVDDRTAVSLDEEIRPLDAAVVAYSQLPWQEAMQQMMTVLDPAIERFRELLAMAPEEDRETVQILFDHEVALKQFAERELAGDSQRSLAPIRAVIERARSPQPAR